MKWKSPPCLAVAALAVAALALAAPASGQILFDAQLSGEAEVPQVDTDAFGSCVGILSDFPTDPVFTIGCEHNVDGAIMAHIHDGPIGVAGPIIFPFADPLEIEATWDLTVEQAIELLAGQYYVNVHSPAFPAGEIRGQLLPKQSAESVQFVSLPLLGGEEVPPVVTDDTGVCVVVFDQTVFGLDAEGTLDIYCAHDVENPTAAHIHEASPGVAGPIVIPFDSPVSPIVAEDLDFDVDLIAALLAGDLYVNVHTAANPAGHIRGQIDGCFSSPTTLCLNEGRFAVKVGWATELEDGSDIAGEGFAVRETDTSGMFWFFEPTNLEILIKVLEACPVNGFRWVFFAGTTDVGHIVEVRDTVTGEVREYLNTDNHITTPILDTTAFECD
jgi:hypothetical protein